VSQQFRSQIVSWNPITLLEFDPIEERFMDDPLHYFMNSVVCVVYDVMLFDFICQM
jgi:hypothetical protein